MVAVPNNAAEALAKLLRSLSNRRKIPFSPILYPSHHIPSCTIKTKVPLEFSRPIPRLSSPKFLHGTFAQCARMVVVQQVPQPRSLNPMRRSHGGWVGQVLTISKLKRWSINYYIDTNPPGLWRE